MKSEISNDLAAEPEYQGPKCLSSSLERREVRNSPGALGNRCFVDMQLILSKRPERT